MWKKTLLLVLGVLLLMLPAMTGLAIGSEIFYDENGDPISFDENGNKYVLNEDGSADFSAPDPGEVFYDESGNEYTFNDDGSMNFSAPDVAVPLTDERGKEEKKTESHNGKAGVEDIPERVYLLNKQAVLWPEKETKGTPYVKDLRIAYAVRVLERDGIWTRVELLDGAQGYMHTYYLGGRYMIRLDQHAYAMREKLTNLERFGAAAFDRKAGEHLIVLREEEDWLYVIELEDGIGGYILKDTDFTVIEYP